MNDAWLVRVALVTALLGLLAVWLVTSRLEVPLGTLEDEGEVRVEADIVDVSRRGNLTVLTLEQTVRRRAVIFDAADIAPGPAVLVGEMQEYRGEPELLVDEVRPLG